MGYSVVFQLNTGSIIFATTRDSSAILVADPSTHVMEAGQRSPVVSENAGNGPGHISVTTLFIQTFKMVVGSGRVKKHSGYIQPYIKNQVSPQE